jgi:hypothetical protein
MSKGRRPVVHRYFLHGKIIHQIKDQYGSRLRKDHIDCRVPAYAFVIDVNVQCNGIMTNIHDGLLGFQFAAGSEGLSEAGI